MRRSKTTWCGACSKEWRQTPKRSGLSSRRRPIKAGAPTSPPSLAPDAKRVLLAAYEESQALGSSYIGPEHVLLALARDDESEAGEMLGGFRGSPTRGRGGREGGGETAPGAARGAGRAPPPPPDDNPAPTHKA